MSQRALCLSFLFSVLLGHAIGISLLTTFLAFASVAGGRLLVIWLCSNSTFLDFSFLLIPNDDADAAPAYSSSNWSAIASHSTNGPHQDQQFSFPNATSTVAAVADDTSCAVIGELLPNRNCKRLGDSKVYRRTSSCEQLSSLAPDERATSPRPSQQTTEELDGRLPLPVDEALFEFLELALKTYVDSWYAELSDDRAFLHELRYQVRFAVERICEIVLRWDLSSMITVKALPIVAFHVEAFGRTRRHLAAAGEPDASPAVVEQRLLELLRPRHLHRALYSRAAEVAYLRRVVDFLLPRLADCDRLLGRRPARTTGFLGADEPVFAEPPPDAPPDWSETPRLFVRELVVFAILLPTLDIIAEPDIINRLLELLFDPAPVHIYDDPPEERVPVLRRMSLQSVGDAPDSLIQAALSEIMQSPTLLYLFMNYLKESSGPLNQLQFLLSAAETQQRLASTQNGRLTPTPRDLSHVHWEAWELYKDYFHPCAADRIAFPAEMSADFKAAIEAPLPDAARLLDAALLAAYRWVYRSMQANYAAPFCQSHAYLTQLCGERPVDERTPTAAVLASGGGDLRDSRRLRRRLLAVPAGGNGGGDSGFTLVKLRQRFTGIFRASVEEGSVVGVDGERMVVANHSRREKMAVELGSDASAFSSDGDCSMGILEEDEDAALLDDAIIDGLVGDAVSDECLDDTRDISCWRIRIPSVQPRRDPSGRTMYVYVVVVERTDVPAEHPNRRWSIERRYNEFYVLAGKLVEFHGEPVVGCTCLPPKKSFASKGRAFVESQRLSFETFLQQLGSTPALRGSELLSAFLESGLEFAQSSLPSRLMKPWRAVKSVPYKLTRERGQNLSAFLARLVASCGADRAAGAMARSGSRSALSLADIKSETSSAASLLSVGDRTLVRDKIFGSVFANNAGVLADEAETAADEAPSAWAFRYSPLSQSAFDVCVLLGERLYSIGARWLALLAVAARLLLRDTLDALVQKLLRRTLRVALHELAWRDLIHLLRDALFYEETQLRNAADRRERADSAKRLLREFLDGALPPAVGRPTGVCADELFDYLQHPRLNKHLTYVCLDTLLKEVFPEDIPLVQE